MVDGIWNYQRNVMWCPKTIQVTVLLKERVLLVEAFLAHSSRHSSLPSLNSDSICCLHYSHKHLNTNDLALFTERGSGICLHSNICQENKVRPKICLHVVTSFQEDINDGCYPGTCPIKEEGAHQYSTASSGILGLELGEGGNLWLSSGPWLLRKANFLLLHKPSIPSVLRAPAPTYNRVSFCLYTLTKWFHF